MALHGVFFLHCKQIIAYINKEKEDNINYLDFKKLSERDTKLIYEYIFEYLRLPELNSQLIYFFIFDYYLCVNFAIENIQRFLSARGYDVEFNNVMTDKTIMALNKEIDKYTQAKKVINLFNELILFRQKVYLVLLKHTNTKVIKTKQMARLNLFTLCTIDLQKLDYFDPEKLYF